MKINYDNVADAMYIYLNKGRPFKSIKMQDRLIVDVDRLGKVIGIEILDASSQIARNKLGQIEIGLPVSVRV